MRRRLFVGSSSVLAFGLVLVSGTPASAAALPAGDELFALTTTTFYSTSATGLSVGIAGLEQPDDGKYDADFDPSSGLAYYFADNPTAVCNLYSLDPVSGTSTFIGPVGPPELAECDALDIDNNGVLRISSQGGTLVTLDKATAATIDIVTITGGPLNQISSFDQDSTGQFYLTTYLGEVYTLDVTTGATVLVGTPTSYIESAVFDSSDTLWFSGSGDTCQGLFSMRISDMAGTLTAQGDFYDGDSNCLDAYALFVVKATTPPGASDPELAATGAEPPLVAVVFAIMSLVGGAVLIAMNSRVRTSHR